MHAIATDSYGPIEQLKRVELPTPAPAAGQVRVTVHASAVNPAELKVITGEVKFLHGREFPMVLGYDFSGVVDAVGAGVTSLAKGDEVFGFLAYGNATKRGAFAEYVVCPADSVAKKPAGVTHVVAAAAATPAITALQSLRDQGRLGRGGRVLIIGASGGVGSLGIGVAKKLGATVTAVCSTHAVEFVKGLGADTVVDRKKQDVLRDVEGPFDVVFDAAAAHSWGATRHLLAPGGTYVTTLPSGTMVLNMAMSLFTSTRVRFVIVKALAADLATLGAWLDEGMKVPVESTIPVRDVVEGIRRMAKGEMLGRIAVDVAGGF